MQDPDQNNTGDIIFNEEGLPSLLNEIIRIKRSSNPLIILSLFLSKYSTQTNCFYPSGKTNTFDKVLSIFLYGINQSIFTETMQFISFLDFQLSIGNQLTNSDYYLLYKIFSMYPNVLKSSIPFVISSQHPIEFFSIFVLNKHFDQQVFHYQLKQTFKEDPALLNRILNYISENKCPINQSLYNNFSRVISPRTLERTLSNNEIIPILEPYKYNQEFKQNKTLSISNALIFDKDTEDSNDAQSIHLTNSQSYIKSNINNQLKKTKPDGSSFYLDAKPSSKDALTKSCKVDKNENKSVSITPRKSPNKDIIIFILVFIILAMLVFMFWNQTVTIEK